MKQVRFSSMKAFIRASAIIVFGLTTSAIAYPALATENQAINTAANQDTAAPVDITQGVANWNFRDSFRLYVGKENETRTESLSTFKGTKEDLAWQLAAGQSFDSGNPGQLKFIGKINWEKYNGVLNVDISNPTIDFKNKSLLVDAKTAGTLSGKPAKSWTQREIAKLPDLTWKVENGILTVWSHKPIFTDMTNDLVGFYTGENASPIAATAKLSDATMDNPDPILWELFPNEYRNPFQQAPTTDPNEETLDVNVPDPSLRACILWELDLPANTPIVNKVLQQVRSMNCINGNGKGKVKDLTGLEYAKNLSSLRINYNEITDLSPLKNSVKLHTLDISNNKIENLDVVQYLPKLSSISAEDNRINDISALKNHPERIDKLQLDNNKLTHLNDIPSEVIELSAQNNRITDISGLAQSPYLNIINLRHNRITDITPIKNLRAVTKADLRNNFISDPSPLIATWSKSSRLASLKLNYNNFNDWGMIAGIPNTDASSNGDAPDQNPKTLTELVAADKKIDAAHAEAKNPVITANASTVAVAGEKQKSTDKDSGDSGLTPSEMFVNAPAGSTFALAEANNSDGSYKIADTGVFTIDPLGVVTYEPLTYSAGEASVTITLTTPGGNVHNATYTAISSARPAPTVTVDGLSPSGEFNEPTLTATASGFVTNETVQVSINEVKINQLTADQSGSVKFDSWAIPKSFVGATHRLTFSAASGSVTLGFSVPTRYATVPKTAPSLEKPLAKLITKIPTTFPTKAEQPLAAILNAEEIKNHSARPDSNTQSISESPEQLTQKTTDNPKQLVSTGANNKLQLAYIAIILISISAVLIVIYNRQQRNPKGRY